MLENIVLLTGPNEQIALEAALRLHNPRVAIYGAGTLQELEAIEPRLLQCSRLIGFVTPVIVPKRIIDRLGFGAYNFHPGPPHYPGWVPSHFAVYERAAVFGVTAHAMIESVDAGPIVGIELFSVPGDLSVLRLEQLALLHLARLFWRLAKCLATQRNPLTELPIRWSGSKSTRRRYMQMCDIPSTISKEDLDRRIQVFGAGHFGISPTVTLHGHRFSYMPPADTPADAYPALPLPADEASVRANRALTSP